MENKQNPLECNLSRLIKLAGNPDAPGGAFTQSLIDAALCELDKLEMKSTHKNLKLNNSIDKIMGIAAIIAILCGAAIEIVITNLAWTNTFWAATVFATMCINGLSYFGGIIL